VFQDYTCYVVPNKVQNTFLGHKANVKCLNFVGEQGSMIATGSRYVRKSGMQKLSVDAS
jgi:hypothetical protein